MNSNNLSNKNFFHFTFKAEDGQVIYAYKWLTTNLQQNLKSALHIVHGMGEHARRYDEFANFLNSFGFAVYAMDQRGHGLTAGSPDKFGHQDDKDGWIKVVKDIKQLNNIIINENPNSKLFLFGHSAGSFLVRDYVILFADDTKEKASGIILSGTGASPHIMGKLGILLAKYFIKRDGPKVKSPLHRRLTFEKYNSHFKPNRTTADWISRDKKVVDKMLEDPYCYTLFSATFYMELIQSTLRANKIENIKKMPKDIPILLISGSQCAVGNYSKGIQRVYKSFISSGIKDVKLKLYKDARHELLNEINKEEVFNDIKNWLLSLLI